MLMMTIYFIEGPIKRRPIKCRPVICRCS